MQIAYWFESLPSYLQNVLVSDQGVFVQNSYVKLVVHSKRINEMYSFFDNFIWTY